MNILTFDIEEWYIEKAHRGGRSYRYKQFDETFTKLIDELDRLQLKATFFCVGQLGKDFPEIVKKIAGRGHEIGCHSNMHTWLDKMDEATLLQDTKDAIKALEDVSGQKVLSYRAPAFSITENNKWAVSSLAECGIENDASIFPATRDFGGYPSFPCDVPCKVSFEGATLKEYPLGLTTVLGKKIAYSGGGYFRLIPYWFVNRTIENREYNICYFHLSDLIQEEHKLMSKADYEEYFKQPGTLKNRFIRYAKSNVGTGDAYCKLVRLLKEHAFVNIQVADKEIDWGIVQTINL